MYVSEVSNKLTSMSACRDLRLYLRLLHVLGILCCQVDGVRCLLIITPRDESYALSYTVGVMAASLACFTYAHLEPHRFYMVIYNRTGNFYETVNFRCSCLVIILLYVCLYLRRHRHISLVQTLLTLNRECLSSSLDRRFINNLILYGVLLILCFWNYLNGYCQAGMSTLALTIYVTVNTFAFVVLCLLLVFFVCLQQIMAAGLFYCNQQLMQCFTRAKWIATLMERERLLALCVGELNECFGLLMLPIVALVLLKMPSGPFYLISTVMEGQFGDSVRFALMFITASFWDVPWLVVMILMLRTNGITVEANKTVKILSKIPRTGTGLDRMVEKFLLKNLRQQPILTAYGFFALDKSTLFNLFTAIFTYMVILVQFKEMENSTKAIQRDTAVAQQNFTY